MALAAGPALANPADLERVEISGRTFEAPVRYDVNASCANIDDQLQDALQSTWDRERRVGKVTVKLVMDGGDVTAVQADGISNAIERSVRRAVYRLDCGTQTQATAGAQIYRFRVDFIDPEAQTQAQRTASTKQRGAVRLAMVSE